MSAYAWITQVRPTALKPRLDPIWGRPTFTTDRSSDTRNCATATAARVSPGDGLRVEPSGLAEFSNMFRNCSDRRRPLSSPSPVPTARDATGDAG